MDAAGADDFITAIEVWASDGARHWERRLTVPNTGRPVPIRRNVASSNDPYKVIQAPRKAMICGDCGSHFHDGRWFPSDEKVAKRDGSLANALQPVPVICPACHRIRDDVPAGVVVLSGAFLEQHAGEIMHLITNESDRARKLNPLNRVMHVAPDGQGEVHVHTTTEKLAQQIGKALHKAYSGEVNYQFVQDAKLARVTWRRVA